MNRHPVFWLLTQSILASFIGYSGAASAADQCEPVEGKILNNFAAQDGSQSLGVVTMAYGNKKKNGKNGKGDHAVELKCALVGQSLSSDPESITFIHKISCEDTIQTPLGPLHSSIWLYTTGHFGPPENDYQVATFEETSVLLPEPNGPPPTGIFQGATSNSVIHIKGAVYQTGAIDMKFEGRICKPGN